MTAHTPSKCPGTSKSGDFDIVSVVVVIGLVLMVLTLPGFIIHAHQRPYPIFPELWPARRTRRS
jgi:hypothetical protein